MRILLLLLFMVIQTFTSLYGQDCKTLECYQEKVYEQMKYYRAPHRGTDLIHLSQQWYSEKSRKRLLDFLKNENWQKWEIDTLIKTYLGDTSRFKRYARNIAKRKVTTYQYALDSIMANYKDKLKEQLKERKVSNHVILTAGWLDDERYIPVLKEALNKPEQYNQYFVKLALARFRVEPYYSQILKNSKIDIKNDNQSTLNKKMEDLLYLATQESFYEATKTLYVEREFHMFSEGGKDPYYTYALSSLLSCIKAVPLPSYEKYYGNLLVGEDHYEKRYVMSLPLIYLTSEELQKARKWFENHKGKYPIDRNAFPINRLF